MNAYARTLEATQKAVDKLREAEARVVALKAENARLRASVAYHEAIKIPSVRMKPVIMAVCEFYGVSINDLISERRPPDLCRARHMAMYLGREMTPLTYVAIGKVLGYRDHTTIVHGCQKVAKLVKLGGKTEDDVLALREMILKRKLPSITNA